MSNNNNNVNRAIRTRHQVAWRKLTALRVDLVDLINEAVKDLVGATGRLSPHVFIKTDTARIAMRVQRLSKLLESAHEFDNYINDNMMDDSNDPAVYDSDDDSALI